MAKAWIKQLPSQVKKLGAKKASWYVEWLEPDGKRRMKSFGAGSSGKQAATQERNRLLVSIDSGEYRADNTHTWEGFREKYNTVVLAGMEPGTKRQTEYALKHFERIAKPGRMKAITSATIAEYVAVRRTEKRYSKQISKATVNRELRHLKAVFRKAHKLGFIGTVPEFKFLREVKKLPTCIPPEHFDALYAACDAATKPVDVPNVSPADWWRGLLVMGYMTGWRIGDLLDLRWSDVDFEAGTAITRGDANKGRADAKIALPELVIEHLRKLEGSFDSLVFPWTQDRRGMYDVFDAIADKAKVKPDGGKRHYTFHDLRRGFATMNVSRIPADALQALMRHQSYTTTQRYINMASQLNPAVENLYVPTLRKEGTNDSFVCQKKERKCRNHELERRPG